MANETDQPWVLPPDIQGDVLENKRKRALANALLQESLGADYNPAQTAGRYVVPFNPLQGLAQLGKAYMANRLGKQADEQESGINKRKTQYQYDAAKAILGPNASQQDIQAAAMFPQLAAAAKFKQEQPKDPPPEVQEYKLWEQQGGKGGYQGFMKFKASLAPQARAENTAIKPPPGYRMTADGNLEAIPGGPADLKIQGVYNADVAALGSTNESLDRLEAAAHSLKGHPGLAGITGVRGALPDVPGTAAADANAQLNTLKSQVAFGVLQNMRNNSKTGGALGNVSDAEGKRLESNISSLERAQSEEQMRSSLQAIEDYARNSKTRLGEAFNLKHKQGVPEQARPVEKTTSGISPEAEAVLRKHGINR